MPSIKKKHLGTRKYVNNLLPNLERISTKPYFWSNYRITQWDAASTFNIPRWSTMKNKLNANTKNMWVVIVLFTLFTDAEETSFLIKKKWAAYIFFFYICVNQVYFFILFIFNL